MASEVIYQRVRQISCANCQQVINVAAQKPFTQIDCPHCKAKLAVPALLGPFMLLEVLGTGGMGAVYRAMDQSLGRFVAIKVMKKQLGDDQKLVESFLREARAAAALNHANIVQIYSCGEQSGQPYIAMELVSGGRLDLLMEGGKQVGEEKLLAISLDVANGLKAANEVNLVHGDIKPANILFDKHGVAKIVDFGLAQFVNRSQEKGEIWGTPYYISPERARGGKADHRSDIYSLGATMYHALTGKPPFDGPTASDVVVARLKQPAPNILDLRPDLHQQTADLIDRMMAADPYQRYPTSASLLADMKEALAKAKAGPATGKQQKVAATARTTSAEIQPSEKGGKSLTPMIIKAAAAIVIGGAGAWYVTHNSKVNQVPQQTTNVTVVSTTTATTTPTAVAATGETFFQGNDEKKLIAALEAGMAQPDAMGAKLDDFAKAAKVPANSGRMLWIRDFQGLGLRLAGQEMKAVDLWNSVAQVQIGAEGSPNHMPRGIARHLLGQLPTDKFEIWQQARPSWFADVAAVFRATELLRANKYNDARPLLDHYVSVAVSSPAWPYALQPSVRSWLSRFDLLLSAGGAARTANNNAGVQAAIDAFKKDAPAMLRDMDMNTLLANTGPNSPAALKAAAAADVQLITAALETEKSGSMMRRDYTAAADNLVALNQKLTSREGREMLANTVSQLDRMDAVKNIIIEGSKSNPFKERSDLGGDLSSADAKGFKVSGRQKSWNEISSGTMAQIAAWYVNKSNGDNKKKADDLVSVAVFCVVNGNTGDAKRYAADAKSKDSGAATALQKLAPGI